MHLSFIFFSIKLFWTLFYFENAYCFSAYGMFGVPFTGWKNTFSGFLLLDTASVITAVINRYLFKTILWTYVMEETVLENSACQSGDREGNEYAGSLLAVSTDKDPDNLCNYLMILFPRADNVFVIAHCCLCISSLVEATGWSLSVWRIGLSNQFLVGDSLIHWKIL